MTIHIAWGVVTSFSAVAGGDRKVTLNLEKNQSSCGVVYLILGSPGTFVTVDGNTIISPDGVPQQEGVLLQYLLEHRCSVRLWLSQGVEDQSDRAEFKTLTEADHGTPVP